MFRVISPARQQAGERRRQLRVDQKPHQATRKIGWSL
jgi:hypothetical protein